MQKFLEVKVQLLLEVLKPQMLKLKPMQKKIKVKVQLVQAHSRVQLLLEVQRNKVLRPKVELLQVKRHKVLRPKVVQLQVQRHKVLRLKPKVLLQLILMEEIPHEKGINNTNQTYMSKTNSLL
ncbi:hypothetical protein NEMIN01_1322 [Nematocida minor]|uniref:uncharacterized protein n=1 Tax=Nematocida minor TaxID=1912983 RepID=UPI00222078CC|nr:uncharacterized protein NEMIN01_1322 [Nematocida minor]KAI5190989.1 hypothetical protein NEMIN01_1322 [Nematocida minor]